MAANLYRSRYMSDQGGFVVYRHCFDESRCGIEEGARAHRQAIFVDEVAALHYCKYRNRLIDRNGSDAIPSP